MKTNKKKTSSKVTFYALTPISILEHGILVLIRPVRENIYVSKSHRYAILDCPWIQGHEGYQSFLACTHNGALLNTDGSFDFVDSYFMSPFSCLNDYIKPITASVARTLYNRSFEIYSKGSK